MLEGGVEMRLLPELHHLGEVLVVDVRVHAEQPLQDGLGHRQEVLGERHACGGAEGAMRPLPVSAAPRVSVLF